MKVGYFGKINGMYQPIGDLYKILDYLTISPYSIEDIDCEFYSGGYGMPKIKHDRIKVLDYLTYDEAIKRMYQMDMLIIFGWRGNRGWRPQKLFEYMKIGKPILPIGIKDNTELILTLLSCNMIPVGAITSLESTALYLRRMYHCPNVLFHNNIKKYDIKTVSDELEGIINDISQR